MKILQVTDLYSPRIGGVETNVENLSLAMQKMGHEVIVVAARNPQSLPAEEKINGVLVKRLFFIRPRVDIRRMLGLSGVLGLLQIIREEKPDIVNVHFPHSNALAACFAASLCRDVPFVVTFHGNDAAFMHASWLSRAMGMHLINKARAVTGVSDFVCKVLLSPFAKNAVTIRPGAGGGGFSGKIDPELPERFVFATGRFVKKKGFESLIRAFSGKRIPKEVHLVITGDGPELEKCRRLSIDLGLAMRVHLPGFASRERLGQLFFQCEVFCLPSKSEALGIVLLEAMGAGKPIVATDVGGVGELVKNGKNGLLCKPDESGLAEKISWMLENGHHARQMGIEGKRIAQGFTWEGCAREYLAVYEKAKAAKRKAPCH